MVPDPDQRVPIRAGPAALGRCRGGIGLRLGHAGVPEPAAGGGVALILAILALIVLVVLVLA